MAYTFEVVIIMKRDDDELSIVRKTHHLYHHAVMQLVEMWTKLYRQDGWHVFRVYEQNFEFVLDHPYEHGQVIMLHIKLIKYHAFGNLTMTLKVPRNPVLDYMTQASIVAKNYICEGWHLVHAFVEKE